MAQVLSDTDVLTLEEAAAYLRLPAESVINLAAHEGLPGRRIGNEWRFLRTALSNWLCHKTGKSVLLEQSGALSDDESLPGLVQEIYNRRGRPESEQG